MSIARDVAALKRDHCRVEKVLHVPSGYCICAVTATELPVFCAECNAYDLGKSIASCRPQWVLDMTTTYLEHVIPTFVSTECDDAISASPVLSPLLPVFAKWLIELAAHERERSDKFFQHRCPRLCDEIQGLAAGLRASLEDKCPEDIEARLWAVNLTSDILIILLNRGQLHKSFLFCLAKVFAHDVLQKDKLEHLLHEFLNATAGVALSHIVGGAMRTLDDALGTGMGVGCDSFAARCKATGRVSFARDFQLPNGRVFDKAACVRVLRAGKSRVFQSGATGMCGGVTSVRLGPSGHSISVGINMLRAEWSDASSPLEHVPAIGIPGIEVLNAVCFDFAGPYSSSAVGEFIATLPRSASWIFPIATTHDAGVVESVGLHPENVTQAVAIAREGISCLTTRMSVPDKCLRSTAKSPTRKCKSWYLDGSAFRTFGFETPRSLVALNRTLFRARAPVTEAQNAEQLCDELLTRGVLHPPSWIGTNYFPYTGENAPDIVVASNSALVPLLRVFQMRTHPDRATSLTSKGIEWRYIKLFRRACQVSKLARISLEAMEEAISFLDPSKDKYWWPKHPSADFVPGDLPVEGSMNVIFSGRDTSEFSYAHKSNTWKTPWVVLRCGQYV